MKALGLVKQGKPTHLTPALIWEANESDDKSLANSGF